MKSFASGTGVALSAASLSVVCTFVLPFGYPWPSLAWATVACAAAVWAVARSHRPGRSLRDVIGEVEGEPALAPAVAVRRTAPSEVDK